MKIAVTVDLENDLGFYQSRLGLDEGMPPLLELLARYGVRGTFFVSGESLGALQELGLLPELVRRGHEIASHGQRHADYRGWEYGALRDEIRRSKDELEGAAGCRVAGYRAPQFLVDAPALRALLYIVFK